MALAKKRYIEQSKVRVNEKLATIEQEWDGIVQYVGNQIDQVSVRACMCGVCVCVHSCAHTSNQYQYELYLVSLNRRRLLAPSWIPG